MRRLAWMLLTLAACGAPERASLEPSVEGRWVFRAAPTVNTCAELGNFLPLDTRPVTLALRGTGLDVEQQAGTTRYAAGPDGTWTRQASGEWEGCPITGNATLRLLALTPGNITGEYQAEYWTGGSNACAGLPERCQVTHSLRGVRP